MKPFMNKLFPSLLAKGVSLYLDYEDEPASYLLELRRAGESWPEQIVVRVNEILQNRVLLADRLVFIPGSTGNYCIAELTSSMNSGEEGHTVTPNTIGEVQTWKVLMPAFDTNPDGLV